VQNAPSHEGDFERLVHILYGFDFARWRQVDNFADDRSVTLVSTPGHTPGSQSLLVTITVFNSLGPGNINDGGMLGGTVRFMRNHSSYLERGRQT
jgi:hypothetical protein